MSGAMGGGGPIGSPINFGQIVTQQLEGNRLLAALEQALRSATVTGNIAYSQLPAEVQQLPIAFPFQGKPGSGELMHLVLPFAISIPAGLTGAVVYDATQTTSNAVFTFNRISSGVLTQIGTVTITSASHSSCVLAGAGGTLIAGDVLQRVAPSQDATSNRSCRSGSRTHTTARCGA